MISSSSLLNSKCKWKRNHGWFCPLLSHALSLSAFGHSCPLCQLGNVCRRSGDVNSALCWHQPGQLIWTNTSLSGNDTKVIALFLQIANVFSCTVGRRPPWLLTRVVIDLDFTKFVWTRYYNKSSKIWQRWFITYQSWTPGPLKVKILQPSLKEKRKNPSYVAHPSIPTSGVI